MFNTMGAIAALALLPGCNSNTAGNSTGAKTASVVSTQVEIAFNADSAYQYIREQCDFGPRVPETPAHIQCGAYLQSRLRSLCDTVYTQNANLKTFDGKTLHASNFIGVFNPDAQQRLLLVAHWDCRPWADNDPDPSKRKEPVMGANDGASGVGVLLEIARQLQQKKAAVGIDILLVDAEDWGSEGNDESWALGTQYWVKNPHAAGYRPMYGILLDMVGAKGAQFQQEGFSRQSAQALVDELWNTGHAAGFGNYFKATTGGYVTDDHVSLIKAGIQCIDIIDMRHDTESGFFERWHTTHDTMENIDKATLKAVGQTLINFIYSIQ